MIKISKLTDYAVVVLSVMSRYEKNKLSASLIAEQSLVPEPTTQKILKMLSKAGVVESIRGANGGYMLKTKADELPLTDIVEAIEGPIALTACVEGSQNSCSMSKGCSMNGRWTPVNKVVKEAFSNITLQDMMGNSFCSDVEQMKTNIKVQSVEATLQS